MIARKMNKFYNAIFLCFKITLFKPLESTLKLRNLPRIIATGNHFRCLDFARKTFEILSQKFSRDINQRQTFIEKKIQTR
jgi:hypothetical protein